MMMMRGDVRDEMEMEMRRDGGAGLVCSEDLVAEEVL